MYELKGVGGRSSPPEIPRAETRIPAFRLRPPLGRASCGDREGRGGLPGSTEGVLRRDIRGSAKRFIWEMRVQGVGVTYSDISITEWGLEETPASELI